MTRFMTHRMETYRGSFQPPADAEKLERRELLEFPAVLFPELELEEGYKAFEYKFKTETGDEYILNIRQVRRNGNQFSGFLQISGSESKNVFDGRYFSPVECFPSMYSTNPLWSNDGYYTSYGQGDEKKELVSYETQVKDITDVYVGDVDGDGDKDIILVGAEHYICIFNRDRSPALGGESKSDRMSRWWGIEGFDGFTEYVRNGNLDNLSAKLLKALYKKGNPPPDLSYAVAKNVDIDSNTRMEALRKIEEINPDLSDPLYLQIAADGRINEYDRLGAAARIQSPDSIAAAWAAIGKDAENISAVWRLNAARIFLEPRVLSRNVRLEDEYPDLDLNIFELELSGFDYRGNNNSGTLSCIDNREALDILKSILKKEGKEVDEQTLVKAARLAWFMMDYGKLEEQKDAMDLAALLMTLSRDPSININNRIAIACLDISQDALVAMMRDKNLPLEARLYCLSRVKAFVDSCRKDNSSPYDSRWLRELDAAVRETRSEIRKKIDRKSQLAFNYQQLLGLR